MNNEMTPGANPENDNGRAENNGQENRPESRISAEIEKMNKVVSEMDPKDVNMVLGEFRVLLETIIPNLKDEIALKSQPDALAQSDGQKVVDGLLDELRRALDDFDDLKNYLMDGNIAAIKEYSRKRNAEVIRQAEGRSAKENLSKKINENPRKMTPEELQARLNEITRNQRPELN